MSDIFQCFPRNHATIVYCSLLATCWTHETYCTYGIGVGSGRVRLFVGNRGSGRINVSPGRVGSGRVQEKWPIDNRKDVSEFATTKGDLIQSPLYFPSPVSDI